MVHVRARPTQDLLREIAMDVRKMLNVAQTFGMEAPARNLREQVDVAKGASTSPTKCYLESPMRASTLAELLEQAVKTCCVRLGVGNFWFRTDRSERRR